VAEHFTVQRGLTILAELLPRPWHWLAVVVDRAIV
jgi:hypothetical protein